MSKASSVVASCG